MKATINLLPKQSEAYDYFNDEVTTELGYGGAAGGGKTRLGWYLFIPAALEYPGSRWGIGRKELKTLRLTTLTSGWEIMAELGLKKDEHFVYNAQDGVLRFNNGSEIYTIDTAYSPQDPEYTRFGGYELTGAWIDESNETPLKAKTILKTRVGRKNKGEDWEFKPWWMETFNPDKGHVYQDYYKPYRDGILPEFRKFIPALPGDNPYLSAAYIDNLRRADKVTRERLLNGNFDYDDDPTRMFEYDALNDLFTNTIDEDLTKYITVDVARFGIDRTAIALWKGLECYKIVTYAKTSIDEVIDIVKGIAAEEKIPYSRIIGDEDGLGAGFIDGMRGIKGFVGGRTPFEVVDTRTGKVVPANFQNLRAQCYHKLGNMVNRHEIKISVEDPHMHEQIREELSEIKQKDADKDFKKFQVIGKNEIKESLGRSPDLADVLMMRMYFELANPNKVNVRSYNPIDAVLNRDRNTQVSINTSYE